jgi:FkbM family methyltransferase
MDHSQIKKTITKYYEMYLNRKPDAVGLQHHFELIESKKMKLEELPEILQNSKEGKIVSLFNHACIYTKYGMKMYFDKNDQIISKTLAQEYTWEENEINFLRKKISPKMRLIDIGANIGYHTLLFAKWVGPQGKVYSFEPDYSNFKLLIKNITANKINNVSCFQKAVSDKDGITSLFLSKDNMGDHRINDFFVFENDDKRERKEIQSIRLDSIISKSENIDFIKMDIQGSEIQAIHGMNEILNKFWPFAIEKSGHSPKEFIEILRQFDFKIFSIEKNDVIEFSENHKMLNEFKILDSLNLFCEKY